MTFNKLMDLIQRNKISTDVKLESDSGWECGPTNMNGVYYNNGKNVIVFTQGYNDKHIDYCEPEWSLLWKNITIRNINNPFYFDAGVELVPFSELDSHEKLYKEELKKSHEFEQYYGVKETDDRYDMIQLEQPLFWGIFVKHERKLSFIGYIGFSMENDDFDIEIYIFKEYRRKGYGKIVLQTLVKYAKEGRLKIYDETAQEIKPYIPKQIQATVRTENKASRALMESCGFKPMTNFVSMMLAVDEELLSGGQCVNCVKYIYE